MSDDFDNDDLSWLQDPDEPEDDDTQDWLPDDGDPHPPPGSLGFTGELPWRQGDDDESDEVGDSLDEDLSWLQDDSLLDDSDDEDLPAAETDGDWLDDIDNLPQSAPLSDDALDDDTPQADDDWLGDIDNLPQSSPLQDWDMESAASETPGDSGSDVPDWLDVDEDSQVASVADDQPDMDDLVPDWLAAELENDEPPAQADDDGEDLLGAVPDWIAEGATDELEEEDPLETVPDWLAGPERASMLDDTGALSEDWLAGADSLPQTSDSEQTFDEWMAQQQEAERGLDLEESLPPMADLSGTDELPGDTGTGEVPDWFLGMEEIDTSDAPAWFTEPDDADPDWLEDDEQPEGAPSAEDMDDFFGSLEAQQQPSGTGDYDPPMSFDDMFGSEDEDEPLDPMSVPDGQLLQALGIEDAPDEDAPDWFGEDAEEDEAAEDMSWLDELGEIDDEAAIVEGEAGDPEDFFASLDEPDLEELAPEPADGVEELLAGMAYQDVQLPDTGDLLDDDTDFDSLFSDPAFSEVEFQAETQDEIDDDDVQPETPDWLTEAGAVVGGLSAAAILRQRDDRPLDELPDRLKSLRERGQTIDTEEEADVVDFIADPSIDTEAMGTSGIAVSLSAAQQQHVDLLRQLTAGADIQPADSTTPYGFEDDPFMLDEDETMPEELELPQQPSRSLLQRVRIDRLLIMLILFVLMALPFISNVRIGTPPPLEFAGDSRQQVVFESLEGLAIGDHVLVAVEYAATAAGELDSLTEVLLQHLLERQAKPVVVSTNPVTLLRANNILRELGAANSPLLQTIGRSTPLRSNEDYYVTRYLSGSALGIRALGENLKPMLASDVNGQGTGLDLDSLDDFVRIVLIVERPDDLRAWIEQAAPLSNTAMLAATGRVGEPLIAPYLGAGIDGLLVGYADALTYASRLQGPVRAEVFMASPSPTPITPTFTLTPTLVFDTGVVISSQAVNMRSGPGENFEAEGQLNPGVAVTILSRSEDGTWLNVSLPDGTMGWVRSDLIAVDDIPVPSATSSPTNTPTITLTPTATDTATPEPSGTPVPSETPLPSETPTQTLTPSITPTERSLPPTWTPGPAFTPTPPETVAVARVISNSNVNIRSGPGTTFAPVGAAAPGATYAVLGRNEDGSWVQIDYPDLEADEQAWIADFLIEITVEEVGAEDEAALSPQSARLLLRIGIGPGAGGNFLQVGTPEATEEATAEATAESTAEATAEASESSSVPEATASNDEARWSAMNIGLVFIILVIFLGAVVNIARAILRRGR